MNTSRLVAFLLLLTASSAAWAVDEGQSQPRYNLSNMTGPNQAWNIVHPTNGAGNIKGLQCVFINNPSPTLFNFYVDGGAAQTVAYYPDHFPADSRGYIFTGWIPLNIRFYSSIRVEMVHGAHPGASRESRCSVSWGLD